MSLSCFDIKVMMTSIYISMKLEGCVLCLVRPMSRLPCRQLLSANFFPLNRLCFLVYISCNFFIENSTLEYHNVMTLEIRFSSFSVFIFEGCSPLLFSDFFPKYFVEIIHCSFCSMETFLFTWVQLILCQIFHWTTGAKHFLYFKTCLPVFAN